MTVNIDSQNFESFVPVYDAIPPNWEDAKPFIVEQLKKLANAVNIREIGFFLDQELLAGKAFIPGEAIVTDGGSSQQFRTVLRTVIDFGTLPNATTKSVPHFIDLDNNFTLIELRLAATDPVNLLAFGLSTWDNTGAESIILNMDANNVNVTTTSNYSDYTRSFIIIEFIQEL